MPKERHYIPRNLALSQEVFLEGTEFHHLVNVMRSTVGAQIELINGLGVCAKAKIAKIEKKRALLVVESLFSEQKAADCLILAQAIPKLNRLDFIIEKGTELGLSALWLFPGDHCEKRELSVNQLERLNHLAIAAMKQSGRLYLPEILMLPPLSAWKPLDFPFFFGSLSPEAPALNRLLQNEPATTAIFCVGPEGGLSASEEKILCELGAIGTKLGKHILRTETAAIAAITLMAQREL
ncbi:MAG: 16S rRNA (uracil(1498)-N(3))-methyltransferase [Parachlamydiaceae bacterium]|nr:16S rRNA (uracil(1498)-N(3))-methyltransferase [Parachlamydiaceae bacterium]